MSSHVGVDIELIELVAGEVGPPDDRFVPDRDEAVGILDHLADSLLRTAAGPRFQRGRIIEHSWGDHRDDRWYVGPTETAEVLVSALGEQGQRSRSIIEGNDLTAIGQPGPRWDGAEPATLERVLFHLVQEYARHLGHLDIVVELANGTIGE